MLIAGLAAGSHGAVSAMLGGLVSLIASLVYGLIIARAGITSAGNVLRTAMRAETSKIASMVLLLWLAFTVYKSIVAIAFFSAFIIPGRSKQADGVRLPAGEP